jgi:hypothetical protein
MHLWIYRTRFRRGGDLRLHPKSKSQPAVDHQTLPDPRASLAVEWLSTSICRSLKTCLQEDLALPAILSMAEQNFSAALATWKGECRMLGLASRGGLTNQRRYQPVRAAEVTRLYSSRAGR